MIEKEGDITIEWFPYLSYCENVFCIKKTLWGATIYDANSGYDIAHVTMPKWWPTERQLEVAQNLISLIELRREL